MNGNVRTAVFQGNHGKPLYHCKYKIAKDLVDRGRARFLDERSIALISPDPLMKSSSKLSCQQGTAYESAAIEPFPQFFQGGLTRTEHQPTKFNLASGAKVGHQ